MEKRIDLTVSMISPTASSVKSGFKAEVGNPKKAFLVAFAVLLVCWTPALLAGFPGYFSYDSGLGYLEQWGQYSSGELNAHHPVLHTLFVGTLINIGQALVGNFNAGVLLAVVVQAVIVSLLLSFALFQLLVSGMRWAGFLVCMAYLALNPIIQLFAFCTTKDVLFSVFVVLYVVLAFRIARGGVRASATIFVLMGALLFLACSLRSNAIVAFLIALPFQFLLIKKYKKPFAISAASALVACALLLGPVSSFAKVQPSPIGSWNALCIPEQQLARIAVSAETGEADKNEIITAFPGLEYQENLSDIARSPMIASGVSKLEMLKMWVRFGLKYPQQYLEAFVFHIEAVWNPTKPIRVYSDDPDKSNVFAFVSEEPCEQVVISHRLTDVYRFIASDASAINVPILNLLISITLYVVALFVAVVAGIKNRNRACIVALAPILLLFLSNLFGPTMLLRYFLYLIYGLPFFLWIGFKGKGAKRETGEIVRIAALR